MAILLKSRQRKTQSSEDSFPSCRKRAICIKDEEMQGQHAKEVTEHISGRDAPGVPEQETFRHPS